mmetsp:Transcript_143861/g.261229  ORF Transcript_143861/g.261229 Transcript_143861/m.261229 type:complete len:386 (-) Transcript_143861:52-1209(-)
MEISPNARLAASLAVARAHYPLGIKAAFLYRLLELTASAILPAGMCWVVDPAAMAPLFVLLWYLPAAIRTKSLTKPLAQPILCFAVDDVSLLGMHPAPRPAKGMYAIAIARVLALFAIFPLFSETSPLPQDFKDLVMNRKALETFNSPLFIAGKFHIWDLWLAACVAVMVVSAIWIVVTLVLLLLTPLFGGFAAKGPLEEVKALAIQIQHFAGLEPADCRQGLLKLKTWNPQLKLASLFNTVGPAWACFLHLAMDTGNVCKLGWHGKWTLALPLAICVAVSLMYLTRASKGSLNLPKEVLLSLKSGLVTENWMEAIRGDKAVLRIPETVLKIYALPFVATSWMSVLSAAGAISGNVVLVAKFVYTEFDVGIENFGMDEAKKGKAD